MYYTDKTTEILKSLPWGKIALYSTFIYLWYKAYGSKKFHLSDIALGILYAETIPNALRGGILANTYALGSLAFLGAGFIPGNIFEAFEESVIDPAQEQIHRARMIYHAGIPPGNAEFEGVMRERTDTRFDVLYEYAKVYPEIINRKEPNRAEQIQTFFIYLSGMLREVPDKETATKLVKYVEAVKNALKQDYPVPPIFTRP